MPHVLVLVYNVAEILIRHAAGKSTDLPIPGLRNSSALDVEKQKWRNQNSKPAVFSFVRVIWTPQLLPCSLSVSLALGDLDQGNGIGWSVDRDEPLKNR